MLYYCAYTWHPGTTREQVGKHMVEQYDAGVLSDEGLVGYYGLVGGGAGFVIVDVDDPAKVGAMLTPSMHLMSWDVRALVKFDLKEDVEQFRHAQHGG